MSDIVSQIWNGDEFLDVITEDGFFTEEEKAHAIQSLKERGMEFVRSGVYNGSDVMTFSKEGIEVHMACAFPYYRLHKVERSKLLSDAINLIHDLWELYRSVK